MYHSVAAPERDPYRITVSPQRLHRQLGWLRGRGLRGVAVAELLRARAAGQGAGLVGLTFDDGYRDFVEEAVPLLRRHDCTATVFVLAGRLGGDNAWDPEGPRRPLLTADGLRAAAAAGMEIGSHGLLHRELPSLNDTALREETLRSRELLGEVLGVPVDGFCYPYGTVDARSVAAVQAAGYGYACAIDPGPLTGRHALPRVHVGERDTAGRLWLKRLLHPVRRRGLPAVPTAGASGTDRSTGAVR
ncbi:polysaccharide deacetylase family protein [Streptomyces sp. ACA25]|nr:polysaccharide deacetylase family protein [Streptomyces sp. ACA25]MDB1086300.1 polysaccharide deacetylase family protein [Streptomyces sp. ACA25]